MEILEIFEKSFLLFIEFENSIKSKFKYFEPESIPRIEHENRNEVIAIKEIGKFRNSLSYKDNSQKYLETAKIAETVGELPL